MYRLVFIGGAFKGRRLAVQQGNVVIGRYPDCTVHLPEPDIAPRHAVIEERADGVYVRALDPQFTVSVNETAVSDAKLNHGDQIDIGATRVLYQSIQGAASSERRRRGKFQNVTMVAVALIILFEIVLLASLFLYWRADPLVTTATAETADDLEWLEQQVAARTPTPPAPEAYPGIPAEWVIDEEGRLAWAHRKAISPSGGLVISSIRLSKADTLTHTLRVRLHQMRADLAPESIVVLAAWFSQPEAETDGEPVVMTTGLQRETRRLPADDPNLTVWEALITVPVDVIFTEMGGVPIGYRLVVFAGGEPQDQKFAPRRFWQASLRRAVEPPAEPAAEAVAEPPAVPAAPEEVEAGEDEDEDEEEEIIPVG